MSRIIRASIVGIIINSTLSALAVLPTTFLCVVLAQALNDAELAAQSGAGDLTGLLGCILLPITLVLTHLVIPFIPTGLYVACQEFESRSSYILLAVGINLVTFAATLAWIVIESLVWLVVRPVTPQQLLGIYGGLGASIMVTFHLITLAWYVVLGCLVGGAASARARRRS